MKADDSRYDAIKLKSQLCFPLYACAKEITKKYKEFLDPLDLTYTQYIVMMVMWEQEEANVKNIGHLLHLDSGTLSPVLKKLEEKQYIKRERSKDDERNLMVSITEKGIALKDEAVQIPIKMGQCISLNPDEMATLYGLLYKMLNE